MVAGILIPSDTNAPLELRQFDGLVDYQAAVGGWVEAVTIPSLAVTIYVNEEGVLKHLPFNARATFLWGHHVPEARLNAMVVGDAVIVGLPNEAGEDTDVPERVRGLLLTQTTFRVAVRKKGSQKWLGNQLKFPDYWGAITWTMLLRDNWTRLKELHVLPASEVEEPPGHPGGDN
tara:strand:- start:121576 stop:122100 length:525 start_codon:yes stop_codon:yes gene_type:complete